MDKKHIIFSVPIRNGSKRLKVKKSTMCIYALFIILILNIIIYNIRITEYKKIIKQSEIKIFELENTINVQDDKIKDALKKYDSLKKDVNKVNRSLDEVIKLTGIKKGEIFKKDKEQ